MPVQSVHVDAMVVAAWNAEAYRTGRTVEAIARLCLDIPAGPLVVVAVDMTASLEQRFKAAQVELGTPWPELLQAAFADALAKPTEGQQ